MAKQPKTGKKLEKARMRGGCSGVQGVGGSGGGFREGDPEVLQKTRKTLRNCLARNIGRGRFNLPSVQHATQGWRIYIYIYTPEGPSTQYLRTLVKNHEGDTWTFWCVFKKN